MRLANSSFLKKDNTLVDYGCGKGRASILIAYLTRCRVVGIDYNADLIREAERNLKRSRVKGVTFLHGLAEQYALTREDSFFFFNPFSEEILRRVLDEIIWSWYENPRRLQLFFYYPTDEDVAMLMNTQELIFTDEIDCSDLFSGNGKRERILVFSAEG